MKTRKRNHGFTLVEILIVVVILGILAAIVIPQFSDASDLANENKLKTDLQTLRSQIQLYRAQEGALPDTSSTLNFTTAMVSDYLPAIPVNPFVPDAVQGDITEGAAACPGNDASGWYMCTATGLISANDSGLDKDGNAHSSY